MRFKKLIFDLDRTLWRQTIEYHPRIRSPSIASETHNVLRYLQERQHTLYVASRSSEIEKCHRFLDTHLSDIHFKQRAIFPTAFGKLNHIHDLKCTDGNFIFFDDEPHILKHIKKVYPNAHTILCTSPLNWQLVQQMYY